MDDLVRLDELDTEELNHTESELFCLYQQMDIPEKDRERLRRWTERKFDDMRFLLTVRNCVKRKTKYGRL